MRIIRFLDNDRYTCLGHEYCEGSAVLREGDTLGILQPG
jgi:hypothetical protein